MPQTITPTTQPYGILCVSAFCSTFCLLLLSSPPQVIFELQKDLFYFANQFTLSLLQISDQHLGLTLITTTVFGCVVSAYLSHRLTWQKCEAILASSMSANSLATHDKVEQRISTPPMLQPKSNNKSSALPQHRKIEERRDLTHFLSRELACFIQDRIHRFAEKKEISKPQNLNDQKTQSTPLQYLKAG